MNVNRVVKERPRRPRLAYVNFNFFNSFDGRSNLELCDIFENKKVRVQKILFDLECTKACNFFTLMCHYTCTHMHKINLLLSAGSSLFGIWWEMVKQTCNYAIVREFQSRLLALFQVFITWLFLRKLALAQPHAGKWAFVQINLRWFQISVNCHFSNECMPNCLTQHHLCFIIDSLLKTGIGSCGQINIISKTSFLVLTGFDVRNEILWGESE